MSNIISARVSLGQAAFSTSLERRTRSCLRRLRFPAVRAEVLRAPDTYSTFPGGLNKTLISEFNTQDTCGSTVPARITMEPPGIAGGNNSTYLLARFVF